MNRPPVPCIWEEQIRRIWIRTTAAWLRPGAGGYLDVIARVIEGLTEFLAQSADPEASNVKVLTSLGVGTL